MRTATLHRPHCLAEGTRMRLLVQKGWPIRAANDACDAIADAENDATRTGVVGKVVAVIDGDSIHLTLGV